MSKIINKNKKIINSHIRPAVKQHLLDGYSIKATADKFGVRYDVIEKYYNSKAFTFITIKGITKRRCTNCMIHRTLDNFHSNGKTTHSQCMACRNQIYRNKYIIHKVEQGEKFRQKLNEKFRKQYSKGIFNRKRCVKRRIKNILNNNFRILKK